MKTIAKLLVPILIILIFLSVLGCQSKISEADKVEAQRQELASGEAAKAVGQPAIVNFWEKRQLKTIYELRDNPKPTYFYIFSQFTGKFTYIGITLGYGIPYGTQFNSAAKVVLGNDGIWLGSMPQSEPNSMYPPSSAAGTWILMEDTSGKLQPQYIEEKNVSIFTEKLPAEIVLNP